jgi:hypothetical protein
VAVAEDDESPELPELPFRWVICGTCRGHGTSSAYLGAFTADQMDELGPEFRREYAEGFYDRTCDACGGSGKRKQIDRRRCTTPALREALAAHDAHIEQRELELNEARNIARMMGDWT